MSNPSPPGAKRMPPATAQDYRSGKGYGLWFYPGFVSRCDVKGEDGGDVPLYRQQGTWHNPDGDDPATVSQVVFTAPGGRGFALQVDDFSKCIEKITVHLKPVSRRPRPPGGGYGDGDGDTVTIYNSANVCPPNCG